MTAMILKAFDAGSALPKRRYRIFAEVFEGVVRATARRLIV